MAITWTKDWEASDDGTVLKAIDLKNIQDDVAASIGNATTIHGHTFDAPEVGDDGHVVFWDNANAKYDYKEVVDITGAQSIAGAKTFTDLLDAQAGIQSEYMLLDEQLSAPSTAANQGALYTKLVGTQTELFFREESSGDEVQITDEGVAGLPAYEDGTEIEAVVPEVFGPTTSRTAVKAFEFPPLLRGGVISVKWAGMCSTDNNPAKTTTSQVYINDVATGSSHITTGVEEFEWITETNISVAPGDVVSIYYFESGTNSSQGCFVGMGQILCDNPVFPNGFNAASVLPVVYSPIIPDDSETGSGAPYSMNWDAAIGQILSRTDTGALYVKTASGAANWGLK